jgi:hypothetical protein
LFKYEFPKGIDLSPNEMLLLADVWSLQNGELGCFKSNRGFAMELGTSEKVVANTISNLTNAGFLKPRKFARGKWFLSLGPALNDEPCGAIDTERQGSPESEGEVHRKMNKRSSESEGGVHRKVNQASPESDGTITGKWKGNHRKMSVPSLSDDNAQTPDLDKKTASIADSRVPSRAKVQEATGEAPVIPGKQHGPGDNHDNDVAKNSQASIDALRAALPEAESEALDEAYEDVDCVRLLKFWVDNFKPVFGRGCGRFTEADILAAQEIVREAEMEVKEICAAIALMWAAKQTMDGKAHNPFWVCNHYTRSLTDLVKVHKGQERNNFERALMEMNWRGIPRDFKQAEDFLAQANEYRQQHAAEKT